MLLANFFTDWANTTFHSIMLWIDSVVYWFASQCYQLFLKLASTRIFEDSFFANFANRIYIVLGIFMLFYLAYGLLTAIVDPEKYTKGDKGVSKIAVNLVISLVILGFLPTIFSYAYRLQNYILSSNVIGSLVLGTSPTNVDSDGMLNYGDALSFTVLNTFLNSENYNFEIADFNKKSYTWFDLKADILEKSDYSALPGLGKAVSQGVPVLNDGNTERVIDYKVFLSTAAGIFLVYVMLSFTIDLGIRVVKFAVLQLIAPIPVIMRILPSKKSVFDKWLKQTLQVYFEVFIRIAFMFIAIYFINEIATTNSLAQFWNGGIQGKLALVIIIMGILAFAKQAPKFISDILGMDTGGLKLGIGEKLKAGGFFAAGSAVGAAVTSGFNPFAVARGWKKGMKDGNFKAVGEEAALRNKVKVAKAQGSTWSDRRINDVRKVFGLDTTADVVDRRVENLEYTDLTGRKMTREEVRNMKEEHAQNKDKIAAIDERARVQKLVTESREKTQKQAHEVLDRAKTLVNRDDSAYQSTIVLRNSSGQVINGSQITGNLSQLREKVKQLSDNKPVKLATDTEADYQRKILEHADKINQYTQAINKAEKDLASQMATDALKKLRGVATSSSYKEDVELTNSIQKLDNLNNLVSASDRVELRHNDPSSIKALEDTYKAAVLANGRQVDKIEQEKVPLTIKNAEYDRIEAKHKEEQEKIKRDNAGKYASKNIGGK